MDVVDGRGKASKAHRAYVVSALGGEHIVRVHTNLYRTQVLNLEDLHHGNQQLLRIAVELRYLAQN